MDVPKAGNFKYYKCRSLLAFDTGGTVCDTSKTCIDLISNTSVPSYRDRSQSENISNTERESARHNSLLVDLTTHLDDDAFNDFEMHTNLRVEPKSDVTKCIPVECGMKYFNHEPKNSQVENFDSYYAGNDENQNMYHLVNQLINNENTFSSQEIQSLPSSNNIGSGAYFDCNTRRYYSSVQNNLVNQMEEPHIQYYLNSFQNSNNSFTSSNSNSPFQNCNNSFTSSSSNSPFQNSNNSFTSNSSNSPEINDYIYDPSKIETESNFKYNHKRKQVHIVKDDSFSELLDVHKGILIKSMNINGKNKKKKLAYNKENEKEKFQYQKRNPFANLKMSSILKGNKRQIRRRRGSVASLKDENYEKNNNTSCDEVFIFKRNTYHFNYDSSINSEFADADYLEYVQPRERIIESDMDKLLSPSIEVEFTEIYKTCKVKPLITEKPMIIDHNGNDIEFQNIQNNNSKTSLSSNEQAERELFLKSNYAKKLGFENLFNTSNDSVINEILFEKCVNDIEVEMDVNIVRNVEIQSKENNFFYRKFKPFSCTLLESLNEINRFGGFPEETPKENNEFTQAEEDSELIVIKEKIVHLSAHNNYQKLNNHVNSTDKSKAEEYNKNYITDNSNILHMNFQSKNDDCDPLKCQEDLNANNKECFASLKIKIKRIDDNKYEASTNTDEKKIINNSAKNIERYECDECNEKFRTKQILKNHVSENHRGPYDIECDICHTKFRKSSAHKKHQPWCQKYIMYKCSICDKIYCYQGSLNKHLKTHNKLFELELPSSDI